MRTNRLLLLLALAVPGGLSATAPLAHRPGPGVRPPEATLRQDPDANAIIGRAARVYRSLGALKADFVQEIRDEMVGGSTSRGTLVQAGASKLSLSFSDPEGDRIVVDGEHIWVYTPSTVPGQVIRTPLPSGGPVYGVDLLGWFLDRPAERYRARYLGRDRVGSTAVDVIELVPTIPDMPFRRAVVHLGRADALPRKLEIEERGGGTRVLTLGNLRTNPSVSAKTFRFDVPSGVRVVDQ
jgi:outer membrane lipoprotein carrier protein